MSKSFKKVATIVGIAALGFATFGIGLTMLAGPTLAAMGFGMSGGLLGLSAATLTTIGALGSLALTLGSMPGKPINETGANDRGTAFADPDALGAYVFGTTTVQCTLVYEEVTGSSPGRLVHDVFAHAWHEINAYVSLTIGADDGPEVVTFSGNAATGTHANMLWWFRALGDQVAALSGAPFDNNAWPSTAIFTGVAHSGIVWNIDVDAFKEKFASVPTKLDVIVEGAMLYDPRLDPAYGAGSQDFGTPSGWTFNNGNAALVLLRFLIGEKTAGGELIWGRGALETEIDMASFVAMANVADETLDGKPRFRLGGMHMLDGSFEGFVQRWEQETGGKLSKAGGVYRVWLPNDDLTPLTTITEADLLAEHPVSHPVATGVDGLFNTARGRYIEPTQGYRAFGYPPIVESSAVTDDGGPRILYHDFSWVQDVSIAQRIARIKVRRSRFQRMWIVPVGWKGFGPNYKPFTVHTLNIKETGNNNEIVRVIHRELDVHTGIAVLTLQQEDASIYDDTLTLGTPFASNTIPNRISQYSTITPRYVDGTQIDERPWTPNLVNLTRDGLTFTKTGGTNGAFDAAVYSSEGYARCAVTFKASQTNMDVAVGLNSDPASDSSIVSLDFAIRCVDDGTLLIYVNGVSVTSGGSYTGTDLLSVVYDGAVVRYYNNGALLHSVAIGTPDTILFLDSSFFDTGAAVYELRFAPIQSIGRNQIDAKAVDTPQIADAAVDTTQLEIESTKEVASTTEAGTVTASASGTTDEQFATITAMVVDETTDTFDVSASGRWVVSASGSPGSPEANIGLRYRLGGGAWTAFGVGQQFLGTSSNQLFALNGSVTGLTPGTGIEFAVLTTCVESGASGTVNSAVSRITLVAGKNMR